MDKFQRRRAPRDYLARREQWRLLFFVMALGLLAFLAREIRHGAGLGRALQGIFSRAAEDDIPRGEEVDTRLKPPNQDEGIPGVFRSPRDVEPPTEPRDEYFPGLKAAYLDTVRDDTFFRAADHDGWFHLLDILSSAEPAELEDASRGRVSFAQLFQQSADYRGHVVRLQGTVRRAFPLRPPKNDYGIDRYYQLWLFPDDNPSLPVILFCLELPEGFPTGMTLVERAAVVGFYFKRLAYEASDTLRTAPTVLARGIRWQKAAPAAPIGPPEPGSPWSVFAVAALFSAILAAYIYWRTRLTRPSPARSATEADRH